MIRDIILKQKRDLEKLIQDTYIERLTSNINTQSDIVQVIIGPRRAGKSFFGVHQLIENTRFGFANFDDERLIAVTNFDEILEAIFSVYSNPEIILLDEIQNLPNWEIIVNRMQRQGIRLVITGSNSNLLSSELATHLTGRHLPVYVFTFNFSEYLASSGKTLTEPEIKEKFNDFLFNGGYPEPLMKNLDYNAYLKVLFDSILYKDIVKRYRIRYAASLESLASWLISNISGEFSLNELARQSQVSSIHTIKKYLSYLEEAFIFFTISRFSYKVKDQQSSNKKTYCYDNGFYQAKAFHFSEERGRLLENIVASALRKRSFYDGSKVFYWKNREQEEVDFAIQQGTEVVELIQVCWSSDKSRTREREIRALLKSSKELNCKNLLVITYDEESHEKFNWYGFEGEIEFVPAWKWLQNKNE